MKRGAAWILGCGLVLGSGVWAEEQCDNEDPPECDSSETCCEEDSDGANRFHVFSGNVVRPVSDLKLETKIGEFPLEFLRTHTSRSEWAVQTRSDFIFGRAGNWRHSYQWTVLDDGVTNGCQKLQVIAPDSRVSFYSKKSPDDLFMTYLPSTHSRIKFDGSTNFYLFQLDGTKYHITQRDDAGQQVFRVEGFWDAFSNAYAFAYGSDGLLSRVTGPNTNHFFELEYRVLEGAVAPGWIRFTTTAAQAEEVLVAGTWNNWAGSSTPMQRDAAGVWTADVELGEGFYEYKFVVRNLGSSTWTMSRDAENPLVVGATSNSLAVVSTEKIIARVSTSDGRGVDYLYDWDWNEGQKALVMRLREAQYGSGEAALYDYYPAAYDQNRSVQLRAADDPHVRGAGRAMLYTYHTNRPFSGQIYEERFLSNSQMVARLEYDSTDPLRHRVIHGDGRTNTYRFTAGAANLAQRTDAIGQVWERNYFGGTGMLQSKVDPMGRTSLYSRTWHFGALLSVANNCDCGSDVLNSYTDETYPFYLASQTDALGHTTTYQRDERNRPTAILYPDGSSEWFTYNDHGQVIAEKQRDGTQWTNVFDERGRLTLRTGPAGAATGYGFDAHGRVTAETNAVGLVTTFEYNWAGKLVRRGLPDQSEESWFYDRFGSVTQSISRSGGITTFEYDDRGNLIRTVNPIGATTESTFDIQGLKVLETSPSGLVISNTYDAIGRRIRRTYSSDGTFETWTHAHDGVIAFTNRMGASTTNAFDTDGNLISITDARGHTTRLTYDRLKRRISTENALGETTSQTYDSAGRVTSICDDLGLRVTNSYDANGQWIRSVQRGGITNDYEIDSASRRTQVRLNGAAILSTGYDSIGRVIWTRNADGMTVSNSYDSAGRFWHTTMPDGSYYGYIYTNQWIWSFLRRDGHSNVNIRDILGRLVEFQGFTFGWILNHYDISGNLTNQIDQMGNNTFWNYDSEGRQIRKTYADNSHWDYTYDAAGRLTTHTDAKNKTTHYHYDSVGNLTNIAYPNDSSVSFEYDEQSRKTKMSDSIGETRYFYDSEGHLIREDGPFANDTLHYTYTPANQLSAITSAFYRAAYTYDDQLRLHTVAGLEGIHTYTYEGSSPTWRDLELANGITATRHFDPLHRLTNISNRAHAGTLSSFALTLDNADQRTSVTREDGMRYIFRDLADQVWKISALLPNDVPWQGFQFRTFYDDLGNPFEQVKNGLIYENEFNNLNQFIRREIGGTLTALGAVNFEKGTVTVNSVQAQIAPDRTFAASGIPVTLGTNLLNITFTDPYGRFTQQQSTFVILQRTYTYDANGNLTNDSKHAYYWNDENRLVSVRSAQTGEILQENRYDGLGRRREKIEHINDRIFTNRYIYKNWLVLAVTDGGGNILETYTHGADLSGDFEGSAGGIGGILSSTQNGCSAFYHYDFNGNIVQVTAATQTTIAKISYAPFGEVLLQQGSFRPRFQFSTKEFDTTTGLNYFGYRFYSPAMERWISRDLIVEQVAANLYVFARNNPNVLMDPNGLYTWGFELDDQGQKQSIEYKGVQVDGLTTPRDTEVAINSMSCGENCSYLVANGTMLVEIQWKNDFARIHEMIHVKIYQGNWNSAEKSIAPYLNKCRVHAKTQCAQTLAAKLSNYWMLRSEADNQRFDCNSYGNRFGACEKQISAAEKAKDLLREINDQVVKCNEQK